MNEEAAKLAASLYQLGQARIRMPGGEYLYLTIYNWDVVKGVLLAQEGGGVLFWDRDVGRLTVEKLEGAGFATDNLEGFCASLNWVAYRIAELKKHQREQANA